MNYINDSEYATPANDLLRESSQATEADRFYDHDAFLEEHPLLYTVGAFLDAHAAWLIYETQYSNYSNQYGIEVHLAHPDSSCLYTFTIDCSSPENAVKSAIQAYADFEPDNMHPTLFRSERDVKLFKEWARMVAYDLREFLGCKHLRVD